MADYFLVHDRAAFEQEVRPALAESWRRRSFAPCYPLAAAWSRAAAEYTRRCHSPDELLLAQLEGGLPFDRHFWRAVVAEVLLVTAVEMPELPAHVESIVHLLAPYPPALDLTNRDALPPILQALHGSRDVTFGLAVYRPGHAGYNDAGDVARLAEYLGGVRPEAWTTADLRAMPGLEEEDDREEELAFAQEWFAVLADVYHRCAAAGRVMILESVF